MGRVGANFMSYTHMRLLDIASTPLRGTIADLVNLKTAVDGL